MVGSSSRNSVRLLGSSDIHTNTTNILALKISILPRGNRRRSSKKREWRGLKTQITLPHRTFFFNVPSYSLLDHERCSLGAVYALAHGKYRQHGQSAPHFMRVCRNYATICRPWRLWKTVWNLLHGRSRRFESCSAHSIRGCHKRAAPTV
jgi:hypothetical protein